MRHGGDGTQTGPARGGRVRLVIVLAALLVSTGCAAPVASPSDATASPSASPMGSFPTLTPIATLPDLAGAGQCHAADGGFLPDHLCTMGAVDPRVTQGNIAATICRSGYTATVRPPESVTEPIKVERMAAYGISAPLAMYELDHLIPLELGGASTLTNLWPEPLAGSRGRSSQGRARERPARAGVLWGGDAGRGPARHRRQLGGRLSDVRGALVLTASLHPA